MHYLLLLLIGLQQNTEFHIPVSGCPSQRTQKVSLSYDLIQHKFQVLNSVIHCIHLLSKTENFVYLFRKIIGKFGTLKKMKLGSLVQQKLLFASTALIFLILSLLTVYFLLHLGKGLNHFIFILHTPHCNYKKQKLTEKLQNNFVIPLDQQHPHLNFNSVVILMISQ